ncbi:hypothetical protein HKCCE2091_17250 [Rhodobacterales bacterium HKCCE2091]|nr:hypothetical protein [Rhodobacterales bacterium HKCCE2091]
MLNFLFRGRGRRDVEVKVETQRETFNRLVAELNAAIDRLPAKPRVTVDPANGHIALDEPEQFPDEALALPKPGEAEQNKGDGGEDGTGVEAPTETAETPPKATPEAGAKRSRPSDPITMEAG